MLYIVELTLALTSHTPKEETDMIMNMIRKITVWIQQNRTVRELDSLTDRELVDIGISRYDIYSIAKRSTIRDCTAA